MTDILLISFISNCMSRMVTKMIDEKSKKLFIVIFVYFLLYLTAIMMHSSLWSDLLSPLGACITLAILFNTYRKSNRSFQIQKNWLLLAAGCFFWILADSLWAFWDLVLLLDPNESVLISVPYLLTNILFAASVIVFSIYK